MTEGEACPEEVESGRNGLPRPARRPKARSTGQKAVHSSKIEPIRLASRPGLGVIWGMSVYTILQISQVQLIFHAHLDNPAFAADPESQMVRLAGRNEIPHAENAYLSIHWPLDHRRAVDPTTPFEPFRNPPGETGKC